MTDKSNILIDELPQSIVIDDEEYIISTNFRTFILFELLLKDKDLSDKEKLWEILELVFLEEKPSDISEEIFKAIADFYKCGKNTFEASKKQNKPKQTQKRVYDFEWDDSYIYSAFLATYRIDLNEIEYLHWWKFKALFDGLPSDCELVKIMGYRAADISSIKDKNERARIQRLQTLYALPDNLTVEEKAAKFGAIFGGAMK